MIRLLDVIVKVREEGTGQCWYYGHHSFMFLSEERLWICDRCGKVVDSPDKMAVTS